MLTVGNAGIGAGGTRARGSLVSSVLRGATSISLRQRLQQRDCFTSHSLSNHHRRASFGLGLLKYGDLRLDQRRGYRNTAVRMSVQKVFSANAAPPAGPYSQAIIAGPNIFVSGQIPADKEGNLIEGSIADKTKACAENIAAILKDSGSDISKVVKVNVFLDDMANFAEMNSVYEKYFSHKPARSCVAVKQLPKGVPVEIEAIAFNGTGSKL